METSIHLYIVENSEIMKNIKLISSIICWMLASVAMAVSLPSSSYTSQYAFSEESFSISTGSTFAGSMLRSSNHDEVGLACGEAVDEGEYEECYECCQEKVEGWNTGVEGNIKYGDCMTSCEGWALNEEDTPLGESLILLPFIAIYAVIRRNRKDKE